MKIRIGLLIGAVAATCSIVGIALATPIVGLLFGNILAFGTIDTEVVARARVALPAVAGDTESESEDGWSAKLITTGPSNFIVQDVSYVPGGHTGWHSHPGILLTTVTEGSIEWYNSKCQRQVYNVGDSLTENNEPHFVRNVGSLNARFMVTYVIAKGQPRRIDRPAPACAAPLGLN
jgi:quercetin dioxygenase-like cupin family protein